MNLPTIILLLVLACVVVLIIRNMIKNKKVGGCGSCSGCMGSCSCDCSKNESPQKH